MGNCSPKCKIVIGHSVLLTLFAIVSGGYLLADFLGATNKVPALNDEDCMTFALRGSEDISALDNNTAYISSDDRENWLIHDNINQNEVPNGNITMLTGLEEADHENGYKDVKNETIDLEKAGFPKGVAFHPHGMSVTPDWVSKTEKQLMVINHAWLQGGERIEIFDIDLKDNSLTWKAAIGAQEPTKDGEKPDYTDSTWQVDSYSAYNGMAVVGQDEVLLGKWMDPVYKVPGHKEYKDDQTKSILGGDSKLVWAKYSESEVTSPKDAKNDGKTYWKTILDGGSLIKSVVLNKDGTEAYVADTLLQTMTIYTYDKEAKTLVEKDVDTVKTQGRNDNLKNIPGESSFMAGTMTYFPGNVQFETERKEQTWETVKNVPENKGGAEEFRQLEDGKLQSRLQVHTNKINGFSDATPVGDHVILGSWIDPNYLICPYDDSIEWTTLEAPKEPTGFFIFMGVWIVCQIAGFAYQWKRAGDSGDSYMAKTY